MDLNVFVIIAGLLPCIVLMQYIYRADKVEKEPLGLLLKIFFFGALTTIPAIILEKIGMVILNMLPIRSESALFIALKMFIVVACSEEFVKRLNASRWTWRNPAFNYRFDGVVYCVMASLGFAAAENIMYIVGYGLVVAPIRAVTSIPLHCICGVFMGHFYGQSKYYSAREMKRESTRNMRLSILVPVLIHGFYDFCATYGRGNLIAVFFIFIIVMDVIAINSVRKYAGEDEAV